MIALLQLMMVALFAGTSAGPIALELGGCHKRIAVPGFADDLVLIQVDGELIEPGAPLSTIPSDRIGDAWIGLRCWAPVSERFVGRDEEPGIPLVMIVSEEGYQPLQRLMAEVGEAQARHREETGSFARNTDELGVEGTELMDLQLAEDGDWAVVVGNEALHCTLTALQFANYHPARGGMGGCMLADQERWVRPLREFWQAGESR